MTADFSIELGRDDPVLDLPWKEPAGKLAYVDLKRHPELIAQLEEAQKFPELAEFLRAVNSPRSIVESAKCDAWSTTELSPEEDIFNASHKHASYIDLVFSKIDRRLSFPDHENFARKLTELLHKAPEVPSSVEICVRRCFFSHDPTKTEKTSEKAGAMNEKTEESEKRDEMSAKTEEISEGFYFTIYISGFETDEASARQNWEVALKLTANALRQLSAQSA